MESNMELWKVLLIGIGFVITITIFSVCVIQIVLEEYKHRQYFNRKDFKKAMMEFSAALMLFIILITILFIFI